MNTTTKLSYPVALRKIKMTPKPVSTSCVNVMTLTKYHYDKQPVRLPRAIQNLVSKNRLFYSENTVARKLNL